VLAAAREFSNNRHKYKQAAKRWPWVGELQDTLRDWSVKPSVFDNMQIESEEQAAFKSKAVNFSAWYKEWVHGWPDRIGTPSAAMAARLTSRVGQFDAMRKQYLKDNQRLADKFKDAPFYVTATLFYDNGGAKAFENWLLNGEGDIAMPARVFAESPQRLGSHLKGSLGA
jgi:hypothetical protein